MQPPGCGEFAAEERCGEFACYASRRIAAKGRGGTESPTQFHHRTCVGGRRRGSLAV
ncbi:MAG: hypothetical protein VB076_01185 [Synergistaceae bacterium]|nr:hypothetical protein [Synergistaceae bacterium]